MSPIELLDVDLDAPGPWPPTTQRWDGCRAILRRNGVPVGTALVIGERPSGLDDLLRSARLRTHPLPPPAATPVPITVAICTKDRPTLLATCLASVAEAIRAAGTEVDAEIVVVDNASASDETRRVAEGAGAVCIRESVPGLDVARNRAVAAASKDVVAFVDDDVVVDQLWLRTLARTFAANPDAHAVAGGVRAFRLDTPARVDFERSGGFTPQWEPARLVVDGTDDLPFRTGIAAGCNMAFRVPSLERAGAFDEALDTGRPMPGGGDLDMVIRMLMQGPVVYEPAAVVFHDHRADWKSLRYQYYSWGKGWGAVLATWYRRAPEHRRRIRGVGRSVARDYATLLVRGPRHTYSYRRSHTALMAGGFLVGVCGSYQRSQRRMQRRRAAIGPSHADPAAVTAGGEPC
ncbi:MAG: glycosyltransferase [Ilumatobacteraceae bacterium]